MATFPPTDTKKMQDSLGSTSPRAIKDILDKLSYRKLIAIGTTIALMGFVMSGPVSLVVIRIVKPQPEWISPAVFVENYSAAQNAPYFFGFLLVAGMFMIAAGHFLNYDGQDNEVRFRLLAALGATTVFSVLISFNYICQTTYVHNLASEYRSEYDPAIAIFSMANPRSLCWAIEMWGYGLLGVGTWLMAPYYKDRHTWIRILLIVNGSVSLIGAIWASIDISWVMTSVGLVSYLLWNVLMIMLLIMMLLDSKKLSKVHL